MAVQLKNIVKLTNGMLNEVDYLVLTCPKELLERPIVELKTTPFYVKCLNKKRGKRKRK